MRSNWCSSSALAVAVSGHGESVDVIPGFADRSSFGARGCNGVEQRKGKRLGKELRWLHRASRLLLQGQCQARTRAGVAARRWLQRGKLATNLISEPPVGWTLPTTSGERFWRALRFGGAGFALAWVLAQL